MNLGSIKKKKWEETGRDEELKRAGEVYMWEEQEMSLDKTRDEFGQNKRRDWAKQETRLGKTEGGFEIKRSEQRLLPLDFPLCRWPLVLGVSYRIIILWLTSVQGAGWRPNKRLAQGKALGRTNAPMRPEGAKALGDRPSEGAKTFAPSERNSSLHYPQGVAPG